MSEEPDLTAFLAEATAAAGVVRSHPGTHWLLACDTDADGLCAAAVMAQALRHVGHRFTVRASRDKHEAAYRDLMGQGAGLLLLDKGTSHADLLARHAQSSGLPVVIVDHHNPVDPPPPNPHFAHLNPRLCGLDGSRDASGATTAAALALALAGDAGLAWGAVALSGAIGDWQHGPSWRGWNLELLRRSTAAGHVRVEPQPAFIGPDLVEAIAQSWHRVPGLHGDAAAVRDFLRAEGIAPSAEVEDLDGPARARLVSAAALRLLAAGRHADVGRLVLPTEQNARLGTSLRHVFRIVDACGREGRHATGVAYLMGDAAARTEALGVLATYKRKLVDGLDVLRAGGARRMRAVQAAWTKEADYTGMVAGVGMMLATTDPGLPLCVLARRPDGLVQVSTRGTPKQVAAGLDLGKAVQKAAQAVGREGGGHPVAAGAVIAAEDADKFLEALDAALVEQGGAA